MGEQDWVDDQCHARDASKMCKLSGGGVKEGCKWSCSGPVDKQPELCGFNAAFNYLMQDTAATVSDDCVAYSSGMRPRDVACEAPVRSCPKRRRQQRHLCRSGLPSIRPGR